jgi:hypothetical protein
VGSEFPEWSEYPEYAEWSEFPEYPEWSEYPEYAEWFVAAPWPGPGWTSGVR